MKRNRKLIGLLAVTSILTVMVFSTLAFFTAEDNAINRLTTGNVNILLNDDTILDEELVPFPEEGLIGFVPGDVVDKIVSVTNTGANPVWVRVDLNPSVTPGTQFTGQEGIPQLSTQFMSMNINLADWTLGTDGWYYFNEVLNPGETTDNLFTTVTFSTAMGNSYMNAMFFIGVDAEGVQSQNNGATVGDAIGWPSN